jgi:hypothetical protein
LIYRYQNTFANDRAVARESVTGFPEAHMLKKTGANEEVLLRYGAIEHVYRVNGPELRRAVGVSIRKLTSITSNYHLIIRVPSAKGTVEKGHDRAATMY